MLYSSLSTKRLAPVKTGASPNRAEIGSMPLYLRPGFMQIDQAVYLQNIEKYRLNIRVEERKSRVRIHSSPLLNGEDQPFLHGQRFASAPGYRTHSGRVGISSMRACGIV